MESNDKDTKMLCYPCLYHKNEPFKRTSMEVEDKSTDEELSKHEKWCEDQKTGKALGGEELDEEVLVVPSDDEDQDEAEEGRPSVGRKSPKMPTKAELE